MNSAQELLPGIETCGDHFDSEASTVYGINRCHACNGGCFNRSRRDYSARMREVGTLELAPLRNQLEIPKLPPLIHGFEFDSVVSPPLQELEFIGAKYRRIGGIRTPNAKLIARFRYLRGIPFGSTLLVHGEDRDRTLEELWDASFRPHFYANLHNLRDAVFVAPNFPVYTTGVQCRGEQLYNMARSFRFAARLNAFGLRSIPSVGIGSLRDRERVAEWALRGGAHNHHFSINAQLPGTLAENLEDAAAIENLTGRTFHWVIFGPCSFESFRQAYSVLPYERTTFVSQSLNQKFKSNRNIRGELIPSLDAVERLYLLLSEFDDALEAARRRAA